MLSTRAAFHRLPLPAVVIVTLLLLTLPPAVYQITLAAPPAAPRENSEDQAAGSPAEPVDPATTDTPAPADADTPANRDLTASFSLHFVTDRSLAAHGGWTVRIAARNLTTAAVAGPLYLRVDQVTANGSSLLVTSGDLSAADGRACFRLLAAGKHVAPQAQTPPRTLRLEEPVQVVRLAAAGTRRARRPPARERRPAEQPQVQRTDTADAADGSDAEEAEEENQPRPLRPGTADDGQGLLLTGRVLQLSRDPAGDPQAGQPTAEEIQRINQVQERHVARLMDLKGVRGVGTGLGRSGRLVILVDVSVSPIPGLPRSLEGVPVEVRNFGPFSAHQQGAATEAAINPRARLSRPVPIGVQIAPLYNNRIPHVGSLGCLLRGSSSGDSDSLYLLSNHHVLLPQFNLDPDDLNGDILVTQSGSRRSRDVIGRVTAWNQIVSGRQWNVLDAAIAVTSASLVSPASPSVEQGGYGAPVGWLVRPRPGMRVVKYGRTTRLAEGEIVSVNHSTFVRYGGSVGTVRFRRQILVRGIDGPVSRGGDSGSVYVSLNEHSPVGLNFAGSGSGVYGVANPMSAVLQHFDVEVVGGQTATPDPPVRRPAPPAPVTPPARRRQPNRNVLFLFE